MNELKSNTELAVITAITDGEAYARNRDAEWAVERAVRANGTPLPPNARAAAAREVRAYWAQAGEGT